MKLHYFQHVPFEGLGCIADWAYVHRHQITATKMYEGDPFPDVDEFDWLVIMGGPMSVYDHTNCPWLVEEKRCIEQAIAHGKVVIGICLGAQLIANVLGANVYPNTDKEIGWFPVNLTDAAHQSPLFDFLPNTFEVFHWHGDTFDLPSNAIHIARSNACTNQAFVYHDRVVGFQFHMEMTQEGIRSIIHHCAHEIVDGHSIQTAEDIVAYSDHVPYVQGAMVGVLDRLQALFM